MLSFYFLFFMISYQPTFHDLFSPDPQRRKTLDAMSIFTPRNTKKKPMR